jgi:hypothetical protein
MNELEVFFRSYESQITIRSDSGQPNHASPLSLVDIEFEELDGRGVLEFDAELAGDLAQGVIEVREMIDGHVTDEGTANFVVTGAAVQPAKKEE